ncbi:MAG: helix-turn-helix transcriptional regulator [Acidimicrobiia bacterium]
MSPRREAEGDLQRVLAMVPWLGNHRGATKAEIAARFGIPLDQLERDLALIMMVGVPPYSPGDYIDIDYEGDTVDVSFAPYFTRPLRLTAAEGLALLAAGRALLAVPGSDEHGPLATALDKLEAVLGVSEVVVDFAAPDHLGAVRDAAEHGTRIEVEYWSAGRDALTTRRIDPGPPFFALGEWYTDAYDHLRGESRMFRVDRIRSVRATDETFPAVPAGAPNAVYNPRADDQRVTLELPASASWIAEDLPAESVEELPGGGQRVVLAVSETAWLERLLLRAGPEARVVDPPELVDVGPAAARRLLVRYQVA